MASCDCSLLTAGHTRGHCRSGELARQCAIADRADARACRITTSLAAMRFPLRLVPAAAVRSGCMRKQHHRAMLLHLLAACPPPLSRVQRGGCR